MKCLGCIFIFLFMTTAKSQSPDIFQIVDILSNLNIPAGALSELLSLNFTSFNIGQLCSVINVTKTNVSDSCRKQVKIVCQDGHILSRMIDASSKFPYSGVLTSTRMDFGNYKECIDLETEKDGVRVLGKHCTGGLFIPVGPIPESFQLSTILDFFQMDEFVIKSFKLSTCTPDGCSANDLLKILNIPFPIFNDLACSTKEYWKDMDWDDIAVISFLLFVVFLMISSTCYDLHGYFTRTESRHPLFLAFSVFTNGKKIFKTSSGSKEQIMVFNGLKVVSIMWISAGHCFNTFVAIGVDNDDEARAWEFTRGSFYITTGHLAVDTFFFISGFLCAFHYLKADPKPLLMQIKGVFCMIFHRYLRLTPALLAAFLVFTTLFKFFATGPMYASGAKLLIDPCNTYWWSLFLYIQNYVNYDQVCMIQTWYLSVDMQLFLLTPFILIPISMTIKKHYGWSIVQLTILNLLLTLLPILFKLVFGDYENEYETHGRINIYLTGIMLAIFMREKKDLRYRFSQTANLIIWIFVISVMILIVQAFKEIQLIAHAEDDKKYTTYFILLRGLWGVGLCWIVYSSHNGRGGVVNWFLSRPFFQILSKLTYSIYLTHIMVYCYLVFSLSTRIHFTPFFAINVWISGFVLSTIISLFWTLAFESPIIVIEKVIFGRLRQKSIAPKIKNENRLDED